MIKINIVQPDLYFYVICTLSKIFLIVIVVVLPYETYEIRKSICNRIIVGVNQKTVFLLDGNKLVKGSFSKQKFPEQLFLSSLSELFSCV